MKLKVGTPRAGVVLRMAAAASLLCALALPAGARAEHDRPYSASLTATVSSPNFVVHYNPAGTASGMGIAQYAQLASADLEEAYSRLVTGGGGVPNAGFREPTDDSDGKTDVYLAAPTDQPTFSGGVVYLDSHDPAGGGDRASYVFLTPNAERIQFRFEAAHELFHVIQDAYLPGLFHFFSEGTANWAAEFALPDVDPGDHNFHGESSPLARPAPWTSLDCVGPDPEGRGCGSGYWTWMFFQAQSEEYGADFVRDYYDRFATGYLALDAEIQERTMGASNLAKRFGAYARDVWDPTRWSTTAIGKIHAQFGPPAAYTFNPNSGPDSGTRTTSVDHLASRYVQIVNDGGFLPTGPSDAWRVTITRPSGLTTDGDFLVDTAAQAGLVNANWPGPLAGTHTLTFDSDPAQIQRLIFPLVNDTYTTDDLGFSYRVEYLPGPPTPPANDTFPGAVAATIGGTTTLDTIYAGGRGADEIPGASCDGNPVYGNATRGVWLRLKTPTNGPYVFDTAGSDYPAVVSVTDPGGDGTTCGQGRVTRSYPAGRNLQIFVGRTGGVTGGRGAQLKVTHTPRPAAKKKCKKKKRKKRDAAVAAKGCKKKKKKKR